jgi:molybdenum cofactor biosynthesis enzyme MoaA
MKLKVVPNYYAPKVDGVLADYEKIHCVVWPRCNFKCGFCDFWQRTDVVFKDISLSNFEKVVQHLVKESKAFKFTGGEPCLNPELKKMLCLVKKYDGKVFLDTNGSCGKIVKQLIDDDLVDVLAISLKGLNEEEAKKNSGINNSKLCWNQVLDTIKYASERGITTIVTRVIMNSIDENELSEFAKLLNTVGNNIYLKINNLMVNEHNQENKPIEEDNVQKEIKKLMDIHPEYVGRIIYIHDKSAVHTREEIQHF